MIMTALPTSSAVPTGDTPNPSRDLRGRFLTGNAGGPGNPFAGKVAKLRATLMTCLTEDDFQQIALKLIEMAKDGKFPAIKLLFSYLLGKPSALTPEADMDVLMASIAEGSRTAQASSQVQAPIPNGVFDKPPAESGRPQPAMPVPRGTKKLSKKQRAKARAELKAKLAKLNSAKFRAQPPAARSHAEKSGTGPLPTLSAPPSANGVSSAK